MKKKIFFLLLCLFCLLPLAEARTVVTDGRGTTASEAENDALRNAVEQAVGVLVDSSTLVSKNQVLQDQIYTQSRGFITNYTVLEKNSSGTEWTVKVQADVDESPNSRLMNELTRLGIIDTRLRDPKIAVYIPEKNLAYRIPDPAGETAVIKELVGAGFTHVLAASPKVTGLNRESYGWFWKPYVSINLEDMRQAAHFLDADILVMGEGFSEGVGDVGRYLPGGKSTGMQSSRARVEAKVYVASTGQILAAEGTYGSGVDISPSIASKKALEAAGKEMGDKIRDQLLQSGSGNRQGLDVTVVANSAAQVSQVQRALSNVPGVSNVQLHQYLNGTGKLTVLYSGSPDTLFRLAQDNTDLNLEMASSGYRDLTITVQ